MRDLVFVVVVIAFFAVASAYVRACAHIVGPEPLADGEATDDDLIEVPR